MAIKAILFDNGGVLLDCTFKRFRSRQAKLLGISVGRYKQVYKPILTELELGNISELNFYRKILEKLGMGHRKQLIPRLIKIRYDYIRPITKVHRIMQQLRKKFQLHMLNNEYKNAMDYFLRHYDYFKHFRTITTSYKVHARKPSKEIFMIALKRIKHKPGEILFIDDVKENILMAKKLGFKAIYMRNKSTARLKKGLKGYGIVVK